MPHDYDPGYGRQPFRTLCNEHPDETVYPPQDFRVEWGPIFHRGRLDGTARVIVIGQDPAAHETIVRRVLVGEAGRRVQGFLAKLGIDRRYVIVNAFVYSVFGQQGGEKHRNNPAIAAYRHRWFDALTARGKVEAVVAFGGLADAAWKKWKQTPAGQADTAAYARVPHPTSPDSAAAAAGNSETVRAAQTRAMLKKWNTAIGALRPHIAHPDANRPFVPYGDAFTPQELPEIPEFDMPPGLPAWMRRADGWAVRGIPPNVAPTAPKRPRIAVTVPADALP